MNKYQVMMFCLGAVLASMTVAVVVLRNHGYLEDSGGFILFGVYFIVLVMAFALRYAGNDYASNTNETVNSMMGMTRLPMPRHDRMRPRVCCGGVTAPCHQNATFPRQFFMREVAAH
ncbi:hypothetical protein GWK47_046206 [Chionoecetes opilio]|uniref:Uncharacterized protein n=1 Tax=Chionoecetes opilio TaxID=41210 RepID=A0A8J4Y7I5_CHIOP|nr:hypothetical protein GWK47_046206 [Chionoecetes opilio]